MQLAKRLGADGLHLGQSDGDPREARALLGHGCADRAYVPRQPHLAMEAGDADCDYVAFGAFYPTTTKPSHYRPPPGILSWWANIAQIPSVAIAGSPLTMRVHSLMQEADFIAVCQAVWGTKTQEKPWRASTRYFAKSDWRSSPQPFFW